MTRRMILPDRVLGMSGTIHTFFGRAILPITVSIAVDDLGLHPGRLDAGLQRDVDLHHPAADVVDDRDGSGLGDLGDRQRRRLELLGAEAVTGDVDDVVDPAQDAEVAVRRLERAVAGEVRPVVPVLAVRILVVLAVVASRNRSGCPQIVCMMPGHGLRMQMLPALPLPFGISLPSSS